MSETILTDEQIKEISDTIDESVSNSITAITMKKAEEEKRKAIENGEIKNESKIVAIDRDTGKELTQEEFDKEMEEIDNDFVDELQSWEDMLEDDTIEDLDVNLEDVSMKKDIIKAELNILFPNIKLYDEDYEKVLDIAERYKRGEKFSYFNAFPRLIQDQIKDMVGINCGTYSTEIRMILNDMAETILSNMLQSQYTDALTDVYQSGIKEASLKGVENINKDGYWTYVRRFFNHDILDKIKDYEEKEDIEKAERCRGIFYAFKESYNFSIMKDLYLHTGKLRVKKIMIEKFEKTCRDFNSQYENNPRTIIDVHQTLRALDKAANKKFDIDVIKEFICTFIRYTQYKNMKPDNIVDHTFMYYFIFNIVTIDTCNPEVEEDAQFKDQLISNINEFLQLIVDKKEYKERNKK